MENELDCDFFFGNIEEGKIKKIDYKLFHKGVKDLKTIKFLHNKLNWISGSVSLAFKPYSKYILTGEAGCVSTWLILILCRLLGKKAYLWTHGWYGNESKLKTFVKKTFYGLSSGLLLYGDYAKSLMSKIGFEEEKMHVIYNSLDYESQSVVRSHLKKTTIYKDHFKNSNPVLIFTGRLTKTKKLELLVQAHQRLLSRNMNFNVLFLGDGPEKEYLQSLVDGLDLTGRYWFYGECYDEEKIGELYYNATACIAPGNVGLTSIHALMYGCPVITHSDFTHQMPEFEAITQDETGAFFEYDNTVSLANTVEDWLKKHSKKPKALINNCYKTIDNKFNPNYQISVLKDALQ